MTDLFEVVTTVSERDILMEFLEQLSQIMFGENTDVKSFILASAPQNAKEKIITMYDSAMLLGKQSAIVEIEKALRELRDTPVVVMTLSFMPGVELIAHIRQWFRIEMREEVFLSFICDPKVIGGALVKANGKRVDHTFRNYFSKRGEAIS